MYRNRVGVVLAVAALGALALGGCGGSNDGTTTGAASTTTAPAAITETTTTQPSATTGQAEAADGPGITPLGSTLKVGEPAVIAYEDSGSAKKGTIELTPKGIETGTLDDFKNIDLDEKQKASTPYYAQIAVKNVGNQDLSGADPATYINGVDDRGQDQNEVIFFGDFARCDRETPKSLKPGESYEACLVYLIPKGGSIVGFHWIQFDQETGKSDLNWE